MYGNARLIMLLEDLLRIRQRLGHACSHSRPCTPRHVPLNRSLVFHYGPPLDSYTERFGKILFRCCKTRDTYQDQTLGLELAETEANSFSLKGILFIECIIIGIESFLVNIIKYIEFLTVLVNVANTVGLLMGVCCRRLARRFGKRSRKHVRGPVKVDIQTPQKVNLKDLETEESKDFGQTGTSSLQNYIIQNLTKFRDTLPKRLDLANDFFVSQPLKRENFHTQRDLELLNKIEARVLRNLSYQIALSTEPQLNRATAKRIKAVNVESETDDESQYRKSKTVRMDNVSSQKQVLQNIWSQVEDKKIERCEGKGTSIWQK